MGLGLASLTAVTGEVRLGNGDHCWNSTPISPCPASSGSWLVAQRSRAWASLSWDSHRAFRPASLRTQRRHDHFVHRLLCVAICRLHMRRWTSAECYFRIVRLTLRLFHNVKSFSWFLILFLVSIGLIASLEAAPASANGAEAHFPKPVEEYHDEQTPGITAKLLHRIQAEPFNLLGTLGFSWVPSFTRSLLPDLC